MEAQRQNIVAQPGLHPPIGGNPDFVSAEVQGGNNAAQQQDMAIAQGPDLEPTIVAEQGRQATYQASYEQGMRSPVHIGMMPIIPETMQNALQHAQTLTAALHNIAAVSQQNHQAHQALSGEIHNTLTVLNQHRNNLATQPHTVHQLREQCRLSLEGASRALYLQGQFARGYSELDGVVNTFFGPGAWNAAMAAHQGEWHGIVNNSNGVCGDDLHDSELGRQQEGRFLIAEAAANPQPGAVLSASDHLTQLMGRLKLDDTTRDRLEQAIRTGLSDQDNGAGDADDTALESLLNDLRNFAPRARSAENAIEVMSSLATEILARENPALFDSDDIKAEFKEVIQANLNELLPTGEWSDRDIETVFEIFSPTSRFLKTAIIDEFFDQRAFTLPETDFLI